MNKIGLIVDEGADLTPEIIEKYQIAVVPLKVEWPSEIMELPGESIFHKMREADKRGVKIFCKTSQPSPKDFLDIFKAQLEKFDKIICTTVTSKLSGTYNSAIQAISFLPEEQKNNVFIIDSLSAVCGEGLLALKAAELINNGNDIEMIVKELKEMPSRIHLYAILEDPKWLEHAGRISPMVASWIRKAANFGVRPILGFKEGVLKPIGVKTGVKDVPEALFKELESKTKKPRQEGKKIKVFISHIINLEGAEKLGKLIKENLDNTEVVLISLADYVVGSIAGPGLIGLAWYAE
ncbi:MAG: DegV family protein [Patescibacteria group bacterium]|nr:DegV family protein [Patescibacteria group bacterium]MBU1877237.1 DegV family protein [Patescibacteria group bacterium]